MRVAPKLARLYARLLYIHGRTFIYQGDIKESKVYFDQAYELSDKLNLFEHILSNRGGKLFIKKVSLENYSSKGKIDYSKTIILDLIEKYRNLVKDQREYIRHISTFFLLTE